MAAPEVVVVPGEFAEAQYDPAGDGPHLPVGAAMVAAHIQECLRKAGWAPPEGKPVETTVVVPNIFTNVRAAYVPAPAGPKPRCKIEYGFSGRAELRRWAWAHVVEPPTAKCLAVRLRPAEGPALAWEVVHVTPQLEDHVVCDPEHTKMPGSRAKAEEWAASRMAFVPVRVAAYASSAGETRQLWCKADAAAFTKLCKDEAVTWARVLTEGERQAEAIRATLPAPPKKGTKLDA